MKFSLPVELCHRYHLKCAQLDISNDIRSILDNTAGRPVGTAQLTTFKQRINCDNLCKLVKHFRTAAACVSTICTLFLAILLIRTTVFSRNFTGFCLCIVCVYNVQCIP